MTKLADWTCESTPTGVTANTSGAGSLASIITGGLVGTSSNKARTFIDDLTSGALAYYEVDFTSLSGLSAGLLRGVGFHFENMAYSGSIAPTTLVDIVSVRANSGSLFAAGVFISSTGGEVRLRYNSDSGVQSVTLSGTPHDILDGSAHSIFLSYEFSASASSGRCRLVIDGSEVQDITGIDNNGLSYGSGVDRTRFGQSFNGTTVEANNRYDAVYFTDSHDTATSSEAGSNPVFSSAVIGTAGTSITITYSEAVSIGAGGNGGVGLTCSTGAVTASYASGSGSTALVYNLSRTVYAGESLTLAYTQPGNGWEATDDGADIATFSGQATDNDSTQDSLTGNTSPVAANTRTLSLTSALSSPSWSSDDTDVMSVSGGTVTLLQAAGGVATITDAAGTEDVEFLPRVIAWSYGPAAGAVGVGQAVTVAVTLTGYGDGASVGTYADVAPSCVAGSGVTFDGFTGTSPNYTANFTGTAASGPYTAIINGVERDITPTSYINPMPSTIPGGRHDPLGGGPI